MNYEEQKILRMKVAILIAVCCVVSSVGASKKETSFDELSKSIGKWKYSTNGAKLAK